MKGLKCRSTKFLSTSLWCLLPLAFFCSFFLSFLSSSPVNAETATVSAFASEYWVGFNNLNAYLADGYDFEEGWRLADGSYYNGLNWVGNIPANLQRYVIKNISDTAYLPDFKNYKNSSGTVNFSGYADLYLTVEEFYVTDISYQIKDLDSSIAQFSAENFSFGFGSSPGQNYVRAKNVCSSVIMQNMSNPIKNGFGAALHYRLSFNGCSMSNVSSSGSYFSWRLNGNNATNGGVGTALAPYVWFVNGYVNNIKWANPSESSAITIYAQVPSSSGTTTPDPTPTPSEPDYTDNLNKIDQSISNVDQSIKDQTQSIDGIKDFMTDPTEPDASDIANADTLPSVGMLPPGPLDSILLLPLNIMNSILSSFGGSCTPIVAPLPFVNQNITFPCFGDTIYKGDFAPLVNIVGTVASAFILYEYFKHLYKKVDRAVSLETTEDDEWGVL